MTKYKPNTRLLCIQFLLVAFVCKPICEALVPLSQRNRNAVHQRAERLCLKRDDETDRGLQDGVSIEMNDKDEHHNDEHLVNVPTARQVSSSTEQISSETKNLLPPRWKLIVAYLAFISFWPLLAFLQVYLRNHEFDIDTYLTVKGILDAAAPADTTTTTATMWEDTSSGILELPPLSPAERLVDSLFGPNNVDRRGF